MNWTEIKEKYPKGFNLFEQHFIKEEPEIHCFKIIGNGIWVNWRKEVETYFEERLLYDFFDENGIFISIEYNSDEPMCFDWYIWTESMTASNLEIPMVYKERTNAESAAFEKAFKILEDRL